MLMLLEVMLLGSSFTVDFSADFVDERFGVVNLIHFYTDTDLRFLLPVLEREGPVTARLS